uniref:Chromosome 12 open reading frame 50 n=1 Tax=Sarcophilus harrisii TaxID=9305 RepID=A0A7N4NTV8_SARHA
MTEVGNDCYFFFYSTCIKQNCSISCFWETQPLGCVKISCVFYHSKPRNINGLFLPPSSNVTLQKETQEGILPPAQSQEPLKPQENISRPIHPPLVITINFEEEEDEEDEDEDDKENNASSLWTKTPEEIEEERAIKEMCYKSGEYYRFHTPPDISAKSITSTVEKELAKPLENGNELQEGDGLTVPTKFNIFERQGEIKASLDGKPRTDLAAFENGGGDCYVPQRIIFLGVDESEALTEENEFMMSKGSNGSKDIKDSSHPKRPVTTRPVPTTHVLNATENINTKCKEDPSSMNDAQSARKPNFKGVKKKKWIYEEPKNPQGTGTRKAAQAPNPKNKMSYQRNDKNRNTENASYVHVQRETVRSVSLNSPARGRPTNGTYNKVNVNKEPKLNLCPDKYTSTSYNASTWRKRIPFSKTYSKTEKIYSGMRLMG